MWVRVVGAGCVVAAMTALVAPPVRQSRSWPVLVGVATVIVLVLCWLSLRRSVSAVTRLRADRDRLRFVADAAGEAVVMVAPTGEIRFANRRLVSLVRRDPASVIGRSLGSLVSPGDADRVIAALADARQGHARRERFEMLDATGAPVPVDASVSAFPRDLAADWVFLTIRSLAEHDHQQIELRRERERFERAFDDAPGGMALTEPDGRIIRVNAALVAMLRRPEVDLMGGFLSELVHPDERVETRSEFERTRFDLSMPSRAERRWLLPDGSTLWGVLTISGVLNEAGQLENTVCQLENTTERVHLAERLARAAIHDPLTGLANRVLFMDRLSLALERSKRQEGRVAVMFLDLDRFKVINDGLGHAAGDEVLVAVAGRLRQAVRPADTIARFGGDEFTVVCENICRDDEALDVAARIVEAISQPLTLSAGEVFLTASIGVRISLGAHETEDAMLRDADAAMYEAKSQSHGSVRLFEHSTRIRAVDRHVIGNDLNRAIERGELLLHYQPIVRLDAGRVSGFEALLRWSHPQRGLHHPAEFIGLAEQSGLIVPIGTWVLEEGCRKLAAWQATSPDPNVMMSINVSPQQLVQPGFRQTLESILADTGVEPDALWLEITENTLIEEERDLINTLRAIRSSGVRFTVDDFGTGYASLQYLNRLPVDGLKIDRSFTCGLGRHRGDTAIVKSVIHLAHDLGLRVVAEGVETSMQLTQLRSMDCDFAQGYLLGAPMPEGVLDERVLGDILVPPGPGHSRSSPPNPPPRHADSVLSRVT